MLTLQTNGLRTPAWGDTRIVLGGTDIGSPIPAPYRNDAADVLHGSPRGSFRTFIEQNVVCPTLIGRDGALSTASHVLDRALTGQGGTLLVSGDAGIGKSRLVRATVDRARSLGFVTLQGTCFEADHAYPYAPLLDLVRGLSTTASPALAAHYFAPAAAELVTLFPELHSIFPDVRPRQALDPDDDRRRLFHSFDQAMHGLGSVQPLLLVIEDVHWSDDATLDLVMHLARRIGSQSIAVVLTFRSDEIGLRLAGLLADLDRARCALDLVLRPLGVADVSAMLHAIFGPDAALGPSFVNGLHGLTEGNPFFVEEVLKALLVAGDLVNTDAGWRARPLKHVRVPRTATEAVGRRLAGLSADARAIASVAAVAGRRFDFALLQALTHHDEAVLLALVKELVDAQLVAEESADRFAFRHALTRETIRAQLLARERVALHRAIATALEQQPADHARDADDALAYHWLEAGAWDAACRYALRAADHALTLRAPREALQQFERAIAATAMSGRRADSSLLVARGRTHETLGAFQQANDDFLAARDAARDAADTRAEWIALHALGMLWAARDYERAGRCRHEALEVARAIGDPALIAGSLNGIGNWYVNREQPLSGIPYHDEALAIFERAGDQRGVAETVDLLAVAHHIAGTQDAAVPLYERSVALFTELDDKRGLANALSVLVLCTASHHASASPPVASVHALDVRKNERAVRLASEIGWRAGESFARFALADHLCWRGEYNRAIRLARESLAIAQEIEHMQWECGARRTLGLIALHLCDPAAAHAGLQTAYDIAHRIASHTWIRWTGAPLAIALAGDGQHERAAAVLDEVDRIVSPQVPNDALPGNIRRTLGHRYLANARAEVALAAGAPADVFTAIDARDVAGTARAWILYGQAYTALGRWTEAAAAFDAARADAMKQEARPLLWRIEARQGAAYLGERRRLDARRSFDVARSLAAELTSELTSELDEPAVVAAFQAGVDRLAPPPSQRTPAQQAKHVCGGLTRRERDAAALIAQGKTNRAIARSLGIGERTVEGYVAAALSKLGFSSRSQIAVWAAREKLTPPSPSPR
ncbi:MAG: AAA family ATPase [bacterium]